MKFLYVLPIILFLSCKKEDPIPVVTLSENTVNLSTINNSSSGSFTINQNGSGAVNYTVTSSKNWLKVTPSSGLLVINSSKISFVVDITASDLDIGNNIGKLTITPNYNGTNLTPLIYEVNGTYEVTGFVGLPEKYELGTLKRDSTIYLQLNKVGPEILTYDISADQSWLTFDKTNGTATGNDNIAMTINTADFADGQSFQTNITLKSLANGITTTKVMPLNFTFERPVIFSTILGHALEVNEVWGGDIYLKGSIVVPSGRTLTIKPGTNIKIVADRDIKITVNLGGKLICDGDINNIINFYTDSGLDKDTEWNGFFCNGSLNMSYSAIHNSNYGIDLVFNTSQNNSINIKNVLFYNCRSAIDYIDRSITLKNLTFTYPTESLNYPIFISGDDIKVKLENIEFTNNKNSSDITSYSVNAEIEIKNSNFYSKEHSFLGHIYFSTIAQYAKNNKITADNVYGLDTIKNGTEKGNSFTETNKRTTPNVNIGCGFTSSYVNSRIKANSFNQSRESIEKLLNEHKAEKELMKNNIK